MARSNKRIKNELGNRYGLLTVIARAGNAKRGAALWLCRCNCGREIIAVGAQLRLGSVKSCGCRKRDPASPLSYAKDETGNRFGRWTVLRKTEDQKLDSRPGCWWLCRCDCGTERNVHGADLRRGHSKSCGCVVKEYLSLPEGVASFNDLCFRYRHSAKKRGLECSLSNEELRTLFEGACHYCGKPPSQIDYKEKWSNGSFVHNGIDRVDNSIGYLAANSVSACKRCNQGKNTMSAEEFIELCNAVARVHPRCAPIQPPMVLDPLVLGATG